MKHTYLYDPWPSTRWSHRPYIDWQVCPIYPYVDVFVNPRKLNVLMCVVTHHRDDAMLLRLLLCHHHSIRWIVKCEGNKLVHPWLLPTLEEMLLVNGRTLLLLLLNNLYSIGEMVKNK